MPGWVDRYGRTAVTLEAITRTTVSGVSNTRELVRSVSSDAWGSLDSAVRGASREAPKVGELVQASAQTLGSTFSRFGQSLFTGITAAVATASSMSSSEKAQDAVETPVPTGLAASLRNRGGIVRSSPGSDRRTVESCKTEEVKDPFLLEGALQATA
eukprot:121119-Amphidinium_carterae.1